MQGMGVIFLNLLLMMSCMTGMYLSNSIVRFDFTAVFSLLSTQLVTKAFQPRSPGLM